MNVKPDGFFTEYELTPEEEHVALSGPHLLAYLQTKRAAYATAYLQAQLTSGAQGEILELERQRAKLAILTELIDEVIQAQIDGLNPDSQLNA